MSERVESEDERKFRDRAEKIGRARAAIVAHLREPWRKGMPGVRGFIDCPVCLGKRTLEFSRSGYNGHVHAGCETPGCVAWME